MESKKANFSEWYTELLKEAKLCDLRYNVKGFVVFQPNSVITMKIMYGMYEKELEKNGHLPAWFPALIPESNFTREGEHVKGFVPEVFWVEKYGENALEERLAMRPTSETAMYQMYSLWIQGASDLPLKIYQSCQVWRCETKATRPFIRSREFYWIEAHDCFATRAGAEGQVREDMEMAENVIHKQFGVPFIFFRRPQWDKFPGAEETFAADCLMPDGRALQLPSTHLLGQNFAKVFDVKYQNEKGEPEYVWQTCYGPAISRIFAAVVSTHGDDKGLVLPFALAPVQIAVVPIVKGEKSEAIEKKAKEIAKEASSLGYRAKADLSPNTPGFKFNEWELLGAPIRIEIGAKEIEEKTLTLSPRHTGKREKISEKDLEKAIEKIAKSLDSALIEKADSWFSTKMHRAKSIEELKSALEDGGFAQAPFCSISIDGEGCAKEIKEKLSGDVRGVRHDRHEVPKGEKCIACGKEAKEYVYVARQY